MDFEELKQMFWHIEAEENGLDNIAVALTSYFEELPDVDSEDIDDEHGWSKDAMRLFNNLDNRVNEYLKKLYDAGAASGREKGVNECIAIVTNSAKGVTSETDTIEKLQEVWELLLKLKEVE